MDKEKIIEALYTAQNIYAHPEDPIKGGAGLFQAIYLDHRNLLSFTKERNIVLAALKDKLVAEHSFDILAGKETGGIAPSAIIAEQLNVPMIYIRKYQKEEGRKQQIEGIFKKGDKIVVIDDTVVTGGNIRRAANVLNEAGAKVTGAAVISIVSQDLYQKQFEKLGIKLIYLVTMTEIVDWGITNKKLDPQKIDEIKEYLADPIGWGIRNGFD